MPLSRSIPHVTINYNPRRLLSSILESASAFAAKRGSANLAVVKHSVSLYEI